MKRLFVLFALASALLLITLTTGCSSWVTAFKADPMAQTTAAISAVESIVSVATTVFGDVKPALPADKAATLQAKLSQLVLAVHTAESALRDAVDAAVASGASGQPANYAALLAAVASAGSDLEAFVSEAKALVPSRTASPDPAMTVLAAETKRLHRMAGTH